MLDKVAVLIPCYNEEITIGKVIDDFRKELPNAEIYVYDNNSSDKTSEIAKQHGAIVRAESVREKEMSSEACLWIFRLTIILWWMEMIHIRQNMFISY